MTFERALELFLGFIGIGILSIGLIIKIALYGLVLYVAYVFIGEPIVDIIKECIKKKEKKNNE